MPLETQQTSFEWHGGNPSNEVDPNAAVTWERSDIEKSQSVYSGVDLSPVFTSSDRPNGRCWEQAFFNNKDPESSVRALAIWVYDAGLLSMVVVARESVYEDLHEAVNRAEDNTCRLTPVSDGSDGLFSVGMAGTSQRDWDTFIAFIVSATVPKHDKPPFDAWLTLYISELIVYAYALVTDPHYPARPYRRWTWRPRYHASTDSQTNRHLPTCNGRWKPYDLFRDTSTYETYTIVPFPEKHRDQSGYRCMRRALFKNQDMRSPVRELAIGVYGKGVVSLVAVARQGVSKRLVDALTGKVKFYKLDNPQSADKRFRVGISSASQKKLYCFMEAMCGLAKFDAQLDTYFSETIFDSLALRAYPNTQACFGTPLVWSPRRFEKRDINPVYISPRLEGGGSWWRIWRYNPRDHAIFPTAIPPLRKAILAGDVRCVKEILERDPRSVMRFDPWHHLPWDLARNQGNVDIVSMIAERQARLEKSCSAEAVHNEWCVDIAEGYRRGYLKGNAERMSRYAEEETGTMPMRPALHQAIINLDYEGEEGLKRLGELLVKNPEYVNAQDPWGLTPVILAAATGQARVLETLFKYDDSSEVKPAEKKWMTWGLLENANTPEVMKIILKKKVNPKGFTLRLEDAVREGDEQMIKVMLRYGCKQKCRIPLPYRTGLTPFDLAIERAIETGKLGVLGEFLRHTNDFVPSGPYDSRVPLNVQQLFAEHNQALENRRRNRMIPPRIDEIRPKRPACFVVH